MVSSINFVIMNFQGWPNILIFTREIQKVNVSSNCYLRFLKSFSKRGYWKAQNQDIIKRTINNYIFPTSYALSPITLRLTILEISSS